MENKMNQGFKSLTLGASTVLIAAVSLLVACSDSNNEMTLEEQVKQNYVDIAYSVYSDSLATAKGLQQSVDALLAAPSNESLLTAREAYKAARMPYQQSEIYRWDTDITLGSSTGDEGVSSVDDWEGQVNAWPLDESFIDYTVDANGVNQPGFIIGGDSEITADLLTGSNGKTREGQETEDSGVNVTTGVHAIEFLLWGQDLNGTRAGAGNRLATDYMMGSACTNGNCERRRQYLKVVSDLLVSDLEAMVAEWSPAAEDAPGTLANNYLNSEGSFDYMLLSMFNMMTDELASARMGAGLELFDTEEEHDCFSDLSHVAIYHNYQGIQNTFYGTYSSPVGGENVMGPGFGELIKEMDVATYEAFDATLKKFETDMKAILDVGERAANPIRFDQIIGEGLTSPQGPNYKLADEASVGMAGLKTQFDTMRQLLSLSALPLEGGGEGD